MSGFDMGKRCFGTTNLWKRQPQRELLTQKVFEGF